MKEIKEKKDKYDLNEYDVNSMLYDRLFSHGKGMKRDDSDSSCSDNDDALELGTLV
jgi:hypothetical protein